jgi:thioredoxin-related protein
MKKLLLTLFFILLFAFPVSAKALELLMAHNPDCHICQKFIDEVAIDFEYTYKSTTSHGRVIKKTLPLIIINVYEQPEWFKEAYRLRKIKPIRGTPTFIIWNGSHEGGAEIGRLIGYHSKGRFYSRLKEMFSDDD